MTTYTLRHCNTLSSSRGKQRGVIAEGPRFTPLCSREFDFLSRNNNYISLVQFEVTIKYIFKNAVLKHTIVCNRSIQSKFICSHRVWVLLISNSCPEGLLPNYNVGNHSIFGWHADAIWYQGLVRKLRFIALWMRNVKTGLPHQSTLPLRTYDRWLSVGRFRTVIFISGMPLQHSRCNSGTELHWDTQQHLRATRVAIVKGYAGGRGVDIDYFHDLIWQNTCYFRVFYGTYLK